MNCKLELYAIEQFKSFLHREERSAATIEKYLRDVLAFYRFLPEDHTVNKEAVVKYKENITKRYAVSSANSMLASINGLLRFLGWGEFCVRQLKIQRRAFCDQEKELSRAEYLRLLSAAKKNRNVRISLVMQTICSTGIRVSELQFITVKSLSVGRTEVSCKAKRRTVLLPKSLCRALRQYVKEHHITSGAIFVTKSGLPLNRSNIWAEMKRLCKSAGVSPQKVFPHSLRHLFARTYYNLEKDIVRLADILGHDSVDTTRIYVISSGWEHEKQLEKMHLII